MKHKVTETATTVVAVVVVVIVVVVVAAVAVEPVKLITLTEILIDAVHDATTTLAAAVEVVRLLVIDASTIPTTPIIACLRSILFTEQSIILVVISVNNSTKLSNREFNNSSVIKAKNQVL